MVHYKTMYKCHKCGTPSYQRTIVRDAGGALRPTGAYQCTGCHEVFASLRAIWEPARQPGPHASHQPARMQEA